MIFELMAGLWTHREFLFYNVMIDILAGIFLATALYPFLGKKLKENYNYALFVFFPSFFSAREKKLRGLVLYLIPWRRSVYNISFSSSYCLSYSLCLFCDDACQ